MAKRTKNLIENTQTDGETRVNKYLSDAGICSRREADKHILEGKVTINGITAVMGSKVRAGDEVMLDGKPVNKDEALVLIAFHKPRGIVCTTDKREKDNIIDFIQYNKRIYPIGRLDKESEGLILLTNDGDIVNKILRAGNNHEKEYIVTVNKPLTAEFLNGMAAGVPILETVTKPCTVKALDRFTFQIILTQGLNRQIRRMCEYFDYKVLTLKRTRIMNVNLGHLQLGGYRNVTDKEIAGLNELISSSVNTPETIWNSMEDASDGDSDLSLNQKRVKYNHNTKKAPVKGSVQRDKTGIKDKANIKNKAGKDKKGIDSKASHGRASSNSMTTIKDKSGIKEQAAFKAKSGIKDRTTVKDKPGFKDRPAFKDKSGIKDRTTFKDKPGFKDRPTFKDKPGFKDKTTFNGNTEIKDKPAIKDKAGKSAYENGRKKSNSGKRSENHSFSKPDHKKTYKRSR